MTFGTLPKRIKQAPRKGVSVEKSLTIHPGYVPAVFPLILQNTNPIDPRKNAYFCSLIETLDLQC